MVSGMTQTVEDLRTPETLRRENRTLRWQVKQLGKQLGKQGRRIYELRNETTSLRMAVLVNPGDVRRLMAQLREVKAENAQLREKLAARDKVQVGDNFIGGLVSDAVVDSHTPTRDLDA